MTESTILITEITQKVYKLLDRGWTQQEVMETISRRITSYKYNKMRTQND